jgi:hypothetical protein
MSAASSAPCAAAGDVPVAGSAVARARSLADAIARW